MQPRLKQACLALINNARLLIVCVLELSATPASPDLADRLRLLARKLRHDSNRLAFDLQRKSKRKAQVHDRPAMIAKDP